MAVYLISYDLKRAMLHNYQDLHKKIASFGPCIRILESTFLVDTNLTVQFMSDQITTVYQPEKHFVVQLQNNRQGVLFEEHWDWIRARL